VSEELGRQLLAGRALFALLLGMFVITVGCGIVLPILRFLIERLTATADAAILSWHTGLLTGTYILAIFLFTPPWDMGEPEGGEESSIRSLMPHVPLPRDCPFVITGRFAAPQPYSSAPIFFSSSHAAAAVIPPTMPMTKVGMSVLRIQCQSTPAMKLVRSTVATVISNLCDGDTAFSPCASQCAPDGIFANDTARHERPPQTEKGISYP
jgi:hypothetical protein